MGIVNIMPDSPGVYRYYDAEGTIIYVGKAKNLKRRVSSYFTKEHESRRTANLVRQIYDLKYVVVNTENDALNLENRMIKAHQPKYVFLTRTLVKDSSAYFGPYTNVMVAKTLVELFQQLYHVRTCSLNLQQTMIERGYKPCLKYHIKKCLGPCIGKLSREVYDQGIDEIKQILRGHTAELMANLKQQMQEKAELWDFEGAERVKERIQILEGYRTRSNIVPSTISDVDVFAYDEEDVSAIVSYFHIVQGAVISSYTILSYANVSKRDNPSRMSGKARRRARRHRPTPILPNSSFLSSPAFCPTVAWRLSRSVATSASSSNLPRRTVGSIVSTSSSSRTSSIPSSDRHACSPKFRSSLACLDCRDISSRSITPTSRVPTP